MFEHLASVAQLISACALAYNIWQTWRVKKNVKQIEIATDGMKDALVNATSKAAGAEGFIAGRAEGRTAGLEIGRNEIRK